jgi:DNA-binding NarL/FixJ family response regulator
VPKYVPEPKTRVALIEGNPVEREYLSALVSAAPGVTLSSVYSSLTGVMEEFRETPPDLILLDLDGLTDFEADWIRELHRCLPHGVVLILSSEKSPDQVFSTLEAGVSGWLQKPCTADQIVRAILVLREGGAVLGNQLARHILDYFNARGKSVDALSARERQILAQLVQGLGAPEIAGRLGITKDTFRTHVRNILVKLKVNSRTEAVAKYLNPLR